MLTKLLLALFLLLISVWPVGAQGPIYLPIIEATMIKPLRSTIGIVLPTEDQNYVLNPSGEIAGNFAALAGTAVTRVTTFQKYGLYSYEVDSNADDEGISLTLLAYPNEMAYVTVRARGQLPPAWDTSLDNANYHELRLLEKIDRNWALYGAMIPASQANGSTTLYIRQNGTGSGLFYLDGVQVSEVIDGRHYSTYIDGTQVGARWLGAPHASASLRSGDSRAGGVVTSFWEGFNFFPEKALGMGTAVEELNIDSYAFLPGGELNSSKIPPREFTIIGYFLADTAEELHEHAQWLELELGLNTYPGRQPVRLRYYGARVQKEISANYTGGLEGDLPIYYNNDWSQEDESWVRNYKFKMRASISFVALDPFWYEVGESATLLDTNDTATFRLIAARQNGQWDNLGPPGAGGTYNSIFAIVEDAQYIYLGGDFSNFDGIADADNIVRLNKQTGVYEAIDTGLNDIVYTMAFAPNGDLIIGGEFTNASGVAEADYICVLEMGASAFTALGNPNSGGASITNIFKVFFDPTGLLWIAGAFSNLAGIADADGIVTWTGSVYDAPAAGVSGSVRDFAHDGTYLYVVGSYSSIGGVSINDIATWDGSVYASIGDGGISTIYDIEIWNGQIIIARNDAPYASILRNQTWEALGGVGLDDQVFDLGTGPDGTLFLAGDFEMAGDIQASRFARFNGYTFSHTDILIPTPTTVQTIYISPYSIDPAVSKIYTVYIGFTQPGTYQYGGLESVQNNGTVSAFPQIILNRSGGDGATIQAIRNERTGRELLFSYALLDGETLTINLNPKNRTITSSFFGPRMDARLKNDDFSVWQLLPGENPVSSFVSEDGSPTVTAYILYRAPFRSWN